MVVHVELLQQRRLGVHREGVDLTARGSDGDPAFDVADTWVLFACGDPPLRALERRLAPIARKIFLRAFLRGLDRDAARRAIPAAVEHRLTDRNMSPTEHDRMRKLADWALSTP